MDVSVIGRAPGGVGAPPRLETGPSSAPEAPGHRPASARAPGAPVTAPTPPEFRSTRIDRIGAPLERAAWFDLDGDGRIENSNWMAGGDAYLVGDHDGNGIVDAGIDQLRGPSRAVQQVAAPQDAPVERPRDPGAGTESDAASVRRAADVYERYGAPSPSQPAREHRDGATAATGTAVGLPASAAPSGTLT